MKSIGALTICSFNYISKALVLLDSYSQFHPDHDLSLVIVDTKRESLNFVDSAINIIWVEDLLTNNFYQYAFCFDIIEFNTNVKPMALLHLLKYHDAVVYLDPDIQVFSRLDIVFEALSCSSIVITPHTSKPILDGCKPDDSDLLRFGAYNLGFVAVSNCPEGVSFLNWWSDRCLKLGYYEPQSGLAVDQKWIDLAPSFFPNLKIQHNLGLNVAFWNLHERELSKINGIWMVNGNIPLLFYHFSSFNSQDLNTIANKQTRFKPGTRPDYINIAKEYSVQLEKFQNSDYDSQNYGFDYFEDGIYINPVLRRVYSVIKDEYFPNENPFKSDSKLRQFALKKNLLKLSKDSHNRLGFKDLDRFRSQETLFFRGLKLALAFLGPQRYFALMKYFAHISSVRNQARMFKKE